LSIAGLEDAVLRNEVASRSISKNVACCDVIFYFFYFFLFFFHVKKIFFFFFLVWVYI
jgi:hypothetical protein